MICHETPIFALMRHCLMLYSLLVSGEVHKSHFWPSAIAGPETETMSADDEEPESGQSRESGRSTCPRQVLSQLLLSFLDAGEMAFGRLPHDASSAGRLIRLILHGMPGAESACMASSGAIGLCQVSE